MHSYSGVVGRGISTFNSSALPGAGTGAAAAALPGTADQLGHGAHGAVDAPGAGTEEHHRHQTQHRGGEHHAVKAKGELCHPGGQNGPVIGPVPGQPEGPQQRHRLAQLPLPGKDQVSGEEHVDEHGQEEDQKAVPEHLGADPAGHRQTAAEPQAVAQQLQQLPPAAVAVAIALFLAENGHQQRDEKAQQPQPSEENVEKAQDQIGGGGDPEIVVPVVLFGLHAGSSLGMTVMMAAGQTAAQRPQPTHRAGSTTAYSPPRTVMAPRGQTLTQLPQATQRRCSTWASFRAMRIPPKQSRWDGRAYALRRQKSTGRTAPASRSMD